MFDQYSAVINYACMLLMVGIAVQNWFAARLFLFSSGLFMLVGTYSGIHLVKDEGPLLVGLVLALVGALLAGLVVAWLLAPLDGLYLGLASLAVSEIVRTIATQTRSVSGGPDGFIVSPLLTPQVMLVVTAGVLALSWGYQRMLAGPLRTISFDPRVADSLGIGSKSYQRLTFAVGAVVCGLAAFLYACTSFVVTPADYGFNILVLSLIVAVIGGRHHWLGPVAGALIVGVIPQLYTSLTRYTVIMSGVILLLVLIFFPDGLVPAAIRLYRQFRRRGRSIDALSVARDESTWQAWLDRLFPPGRPGAEPEVAALAVESVDFSYGGVHALRNVSITVGTGEILGIIGPNGAGKSTLLNAISGVTTADSGTIRYFGGEPRRHDAVSLVRAGVVRTFQRSYLVPGLDVVANLALGRPRKGLVVGGIEIGPAAQRDRLAVARLSLRAFGLEGAGPLRPEEQPLGTRRLVEVIRAVNQAPRLLLLDEPTAGMDADEVVKFEELLLDLSRRSVTILLISHDLDVIQKTCQRIHVLSLGESIADVPAGELLTDPRIAGAYLGRQESVR